jgi:transposase
MPTITSNQRRAAKESLLADLQQGYSVPEASTRAAIPLHRTTIYRFRRRVQANPVTALEDGRHGHPIKLRGEVRDWLVAFCQETPHTPSHVVQAALLERFGVLVSISQLNRFRAAHDVSSRTRGKKVGSGHKPGVIAGADVAGRSWLPAPASGSQRDRPD